MALLTHLIQISTFITMQFVKAVTPGIRDNTDLVVAFPTGSENTIKALREAWLGDIPGNDTVMDMMAEVTQEEHQSMIINVADVWSPSTERIYTCIVDPIDEKFVMCDRDAWNEHEDQLIELGMGYLLQYDDWNLVPTTYDP